MKDFIGIEGYITIYELDRNNKVLTAYPKIKNRILNAGYREVTRLVASGIGPFYDPVGNPITHCVIGRGGAIVPPSHFLDSTDDERTTLITEFSNSFGGITDVVVPNWKFTNNYTSIIFMASFNADNTLYSHYYPLGQDTVNEVGLIIGNRIADTADRLFCAKDFQISGPAITLKSFTTLVIEYEIRFVRP